MIHGTGSVSWSELHAHTHYSLLDGASSPEAMVKRAAALGYRALAITDHDSLAGLVAHARACQAAGIVPIAGVELTMSDGTHLTLVARDEDGYRSLCRLVSTSQLAGEKGAPLATFADLDSNSAGIECLTGCRKGPVAAAVLRDDRRAAFRALSGLVEIFGRAHTWVEIQLPGLADEQVVAYNLARLARRAGVGLAATGDAHFAEPVEHDLQDVLVCMRERVSIQEARPHLRPGSSAHLRTPQEMAGRFADLPAALLGTEELAERCRFDLSSVDSRLPAFAVPEGQTSASYLRELAEKGLRDRYGDAADSDAVRTRFAHELEVITYHDLFDYFLIVWDFVRHARGLGMLCQARGSSVGSLVCYALGISAIEPLAHRLSFDRFLDIGRIDPPDIDLDLPSDRDATLAREAVIQYALSHYRGHAALVSTAITFRARLATREVGMALGLDREAQGALANEQEHFSHHTRFPILPGLAGRLPDLCRRLEGTPRHLGQHPGGLVLTAGPLGEVAPIERARMPGRIVIQWDKDSAELAGLAKIDLLGLGMLAVIQRCFATIAERTGERLELHGFTCDDPAVYDAFCACDTVGVFQLESRAQMSACLPMLQPRTLHDLAVAVALIRPGPIQGGVVQPYLRRRRGMEKIAYPGGKAGRELLEPVLADTLGVMLFQDQVIELGRACGLEPAEAAELRRAMSSARSASRMAHLTERLREQLRKRGIGDQAGEDILTNMTAFSGYGFVRGHAYAFGYLSYVSCWLKVHHPAVFAAALLDAQPMGFYPPELVVQDAVRHGVTVRPVDIFASGEPCTIEPDGAVRLGLRQIRDMSEAAGSRIVAAMRRERPATTFEDLCTEAELDAGDALALARSGALRALIPNRRQAMWQAKVVARARREGWLPRAVEVVDPPVALAPTTPLEDLVLDRQALGLSPGQHVFTHFRERLNAQGCSCSTDLAKLPPGMPVRIAGQQIGTQRPPTAGGVVFESLSDETGLVNIVVMPDVYERDRRVIKGEALVLVEGNVEWRTGAVAVRARRVVPLSEALARTPHQPTLSPGNALEDAQARKSVNAGIASRWG